MFASTILEIRDANLALRSVTATSELERILALTASGLSVVHLARVPLGVATISPSIGPTAGGTAITIRGSGFQSGVGVAISGQTAELTLADMNTLKIVTPALSSGAQRVIITNSDGELVSWDAVFIAN